MEHQDQQAQWIKKVMALHQAIESALSRQWVLMDDRHCREKAPLNKALKIVKHLNILVNEGELSFQRYQKKLKTLMTFIEELALYDFVAEELLKSFGSEGHPLSSEDPFTSMLAFMSIVKGINL